MNVSLRKAFAICTELQNTRQQNVDGAIQVNLFSEDEFVIAPYVQSYNKKLEAAVQDALLINRVVSEIRSKLDIANHVMVDIGTQTLSVASVLALKAEYERNMMALNLFSKVPAADIVDRFEKDCAAREQHVSAQSKALARSVTQVNGMTGVSINLIEPQLYAEYNQLYHMNKRLQADCVDKLALLNNRLEIELSAEAVALAKRQQLI